MRSWVSKALLLGAVALLPLRAEAGKRPFTWAYDTEIVPEGELELEQWLWARGRAVDQYASRSARYWLWWGPVIGLSDHFELAVPFQVVSWAQPGGQETYLESFEADLRYRIKPRGDSDPLQSLIRLAYHQPTGSVSEHPRIDANVVNSYDFASGLHLVLDLGWKFGLAPLSPSGGNMTVQMTYDLGVAYPVSDEIRVSAENFAEIPVSNLAGSTHEFVGPAVEWTRGRMWLTFGVLVGLTPALPQTPRVMPRLIWAVAL